MTQKTPEKHHFNAEVAKILHLVIHSLYANKDIFIRELVSNSSDACDKLRFEAQKNPKLAQENLKITISTNEKAKTITITDTGIGMTREEMIENLGTIAKSGTAAFAEKLKAKDDVNLIGQFGVGFYSSFMVAESVTVTSKKAGTEQAHKWQSTGEGEFTIDEEFNVEAGTKIELKLRKGEEKYLDKHIIKNIVKTYSDFLATPVYFVDSDGKEEKLNSGTALWMRDKKDINPEEYQAFYKSAAQQIDKPFLTLHGRAEGKLEYNYLLFIPSTKPFDLFHPDRMRRLKLYVRRVFIAEENIEIIPRYLRFVRGVVDSEDLPLNISRETLQANPMLEKIRTALTKKILSELKKKAENAPEEYEKFWQNFGAVLKEGLCESIDAKEPLLEICRFNTTLSDKKTTLDEYISRNAEAKEILYFSGDDLTAMKQSPQLEGYLKRGQEVLLFTDSVDDFWVNVAFEYKDKTFKSVTRADATNDQQPITNDKNINKLIELFKKELGEKVRDVISSTKLEESPVCLAVGAGDMDIRMERFLHNQKQLPTKSAKILEINPNHPLILALAEKGENEEVRDTINLLFDQALILEGEEISDLKQFSTRLNKLLLRSSAA